jgi:2'-5' RNA ligase
MSVPVVPIPRAELDAIGMRFAAEVVAAMDATLAEMLDGIPDRVTAAAWLDAFRRNPRLPTDTDAAAIPTIWRRRVAGLSRRVFDVFARSAVATRDQSSAAAYVPDDWAARVEAGMPSVAVPTVRDWRDMVTAGTPFIPPRTADPVMETVRRNLSTIGDDLWVDVAAAIQAGRDANEGVEQVTARIQAVLNNAQWKARRIARTEITRGANAASLAQTMHSGYLGEKVWSSNTDSRVRPAHLETNEQARPLNDTFDVGGFPMLYPGDPTAPPELTINCRCDMIYALTAEQALPWMSGIGEGGPPADSVAEQAWDFEEWETLVASDETINAQSTMPEQLKRYWLSGEGAALIGWGTPGSFTRCVNALRDDFPKDPEGLCANLEHEATGHWPGEGRGAKTSVNAGHTGAMIALVPRPEDAARFARVGGEPVDQLHVTMAFLGDAVDWTPEQRVDVIGRMRDTYAGRGVVDADAFSVNVFNPGTTNDREPCLVMGLSGDTLPGIHGGVHEVLGDPPIPEQHTPFVPHMTLRYMPDAVNEEMGAHAAEAMGLVGPVTFDRLRVAFADDVYDIMLTPAASGMVGDYPDVEDLLEPDEVAEPDNMVDWTGPLPSVDEDGAWSGVLTVEGIPSGDGRLFMPGSLDVAPLPLPLRWQKEDAPEHQGAVIVGRIDDIWRDGPNIMANGVLDMEDEDGLEVFRKMRGRFLRGVSIEADMIDGEIMGDGITSPETEVYQAGRIRGATLLAIPAYVEGEIMLKDQPAAVIACGCDVVDPDTDHTIVIRNTPPSEWFTEPRDVEMHGALTVTDQGRVYGLLAPDGVAHRSFGDRDVHVPRRVDYAAFLGGETLVAGGGRVVTGPITMNCGHASTGYGVGTDAAMEHYDNTCSVVANITVGENTRGVWVAGALRPGVTPEQVVTMMGCRLSGDWRPHRRDAGKRELAAALLVPVPGFAEARGRASVMVASGEMVTSSIPVEFTVSAAPQPPAPRDVIRLSLRRRLGTDRESRRAALAERFGRI